jgi:glycerophosphoryl diester phosphodiesterase
MGEYGIGTRPQVLAHRGYHPAGGPEGNSLGAFQAGIDLGVDALELDVRRTRDGVLVIHHDATVDDGRTIADLDYAQLPPLADGQRIPTLAQVADLAGRTGAHLAVELKEGGYEREAVDTLLARMPVGQLEMISFDQDAMAKVERYHPEIRTGILARPLPGFLRSTPLYPVVLAAMDFLHWHPSLNAAARIGADYVSIEHRGATHSYIADARSRGIGVDAWTVDDPAEIQRLLDEGIQGIVSDRPDLALQQRAELPYD